MRLGKKLFYDKVTGSVIVDTGQWDNAIAPLTVEEEVAIYKALSERNRETFDVIELPYGAYAQDFANGRLIGVDLEKKIPIFEYPNPAEPGTPIVPAVPFSVELAAIKEENSELLFQNAMQDMTIAAMQEENAELLFQNALRDMKLETVESDTAELMFKIATIEMGAM